MHRQGAAARTVRGVLCGTMGPLSAIQGGEELPERNFADRGLKAAARLMAAVSSSNEPIAPVFAENVSGRALHDVRQRSGPVAYHDKPTRRSAALRPPSARMV